MQSTHDLSLMNIFHLLCKVILQALCAMCFSALKLISHNYYVGDNCGPCTGTCHVVYFYNLRVFCTWYTTLLVSLCNFVQFKHHCT